jgi:hypothetical protein
MPPYQAIVNTSADAGFTFAFGAFGTKFIGAATINALPNGTASQRITYFNLKAKIKIFYINLTKTILNFVHNSPSGILGWDGAPAGTQPLSRGTGVTSVKPTWGSGPWFIPPFILEYVYNFNGLQLQPEFSFLPASSALDEDNITATSLYGPHIGSFYSPPGNDPTILQKYVAQERVVQSGVNVYNLQHTDFTARNSNWIFNEMQNISNQTINCTGVSECTNFNFTISGPDIFCSSPSATYTIPTLPTGATVTWSTIPTGIATPNTPNAIQTTLNKNSNGVMGAIQIFAI